MKAILKILILLLLFVPRPTLADNLSAFTKDILAVLNETIGKTEDGKLRLELDKAELLFELTQTNKRINCMVLHDSYVDEENQALLNRVESGSAKFDLTYPGLDLSKFEPGLVHLKKGQSRVLIMKGELDGEPVYFRLEISEGKKGILSYVKVNKTKTKEKENYEAIFEEKTPSELKKVGYKGDSKIVGVKGSNKIGASENEINWSVKKDSSSAELVIKTDENPDKIIVGLNRKGEDQGELKAGFEKKIGELEVKGGTSKKSDKRAVHNGSVKIGNEKASLKVDVELGEESTKTGLKAKKKLGDLDLESKYSGEAESGEYDVTAGAGIKIDEQQKITLEAGVNEKSEESLSVNYTHTSKDKKTKFEMAGKAIIVEEAETGIEAKVKVSKELKNEKDELSVSVAPTLDTSGAVKAIVVEAGWDRKINEGAKVGIFAKSSVSPSGNSEEQHDIGIKANFEFGGPNKEIKILSVYKLHKTQIEENNGKYKAAYYLIWKYNCNQRTKKLRIDKPRKKLFGGYDLKHLPMTAMDVDDMPVTEYTIPSGIDKDNFCK
ncbi:MAG: hypothetical protein ACJAT2_002229 [Bacteriovoracaceae bacterium]|jgi:hypothetical protein